MATTVTCDKCGRDCTNNAVRASAEWDGPAVNGEANLDLCQSCTQLFKKWLTEPFDRAA